MDIDGFGTKLVDQLVNNGIIKNISNIYELNIEKLIKLKKVKPHFPSLTKRGVKSKHNVVYIELLLLSIFLICNYFNR